MAGMIEQSLISLILDGAGLELLQDNNLTPSMFLTCKDEISFIIEHNDYYKQIPDKLTFLAEFKDFQMLEVTESPSYLAYKLREAYLYTQIAPILQNTADKVREDSIEALEFLKGCIAELEANTPAQIKGNGYDIVAQAKDRLEAYIERCKVKGLIGIPTGIPQLDELTNGWLAGEDLIVITGRTNMGKSWIGEYFGTTAWRAGKKVLMYSGEMSRDIVGFRFDTLNAHYSNMGLLNGSKSLCAEQDYGEYIDELTQQSGFIVITPEDLGGKKPTVRDIKRVAEKVNPDLIIVDQLSLMADQQRAEQTRIQFSNISEDLFLMSKELKTPVIAMAQANREAVKTKKKGESPELTDLAESDGIAQNATRVISITVLDGTLKLSLKKNRYGINNRDVLMIWDINLGVLKPLIENPETEDGDDITAEEKDYGF